MSRADLARGTGLSRTTVSSLVTELIGSRPGHRDHRPRTAAQGRQRTAAACWSRSAPRPAGWPASTSATGTSGSPSPTAPGRCWPRRSRCVDVDAHGARGARPGRPRWSATAAPAARRRPWRTCTPSACACRRRSTGARRRSAPASCPAGAACSPARSSSAGSACPCSPTTTPTSAPWPSSTTASARGTSDMLYVKVASGLGAGIVLGGRLHRGASGIAGEIGHVQVGEDGQVCRCGNRGCLETVVSAPRLLGAAAAGVRRRAVDRARPRARRGGRPRRTPGAERRRPHGRARTGRPRQQPQPRAGGRRRLARRRRRRWSTGIRGLDRPLRAAGHRRRRCGWSPASSASAPRWSVRWRSRSPGWRCRQRSALRAGRATTTGSARCPSSAPPAPAARGRR